MEWKENVEKIENKIADTFGKIIAKVKNSVDGFVSDETGASDLVTALILIVIVIAVAAVFKDQLVKIVNAIGNKVMTWISSH